MSDFFAEQQASMPPELSQDKVDWEFELLERAKEIHAKYQIVDPSEMTFADKVELEMYLSRARGDDIQDL